MPWVSAHTHARRGGGRVKVVHARACATATEVSRAARARGKCYLASSLNRARLRTGVNLSCERGKRHSYCFLVFYTVYHIETNSGAV